jgi:predicted phage-related endonuclease
VGQPLPSPEKEKLFRRGAKMEPYIIDLLAEEEGLTIVGRGNRYIDKQHGFMAAEIDAETDDGRNVEIKTVSPFKAKEWGEEDTDAIPVHYTAQAMHGLMVTDRKVCIFGVLIGGDDFRVYRVERDDEIVGAIREKEVAFWDRIQRKEPPEPSTPNDLMRLYGAKDNGDFIEATKEIIGDYEALKHKKLLARDLEKEIDALTGNIQLYMGARSLLMVNGSPAISWKSQESRRFDQSAFKAVHPELFEQFKTVSESRVFRIK